MFFRYPIEAETKDWLVESFHWAIGTGILGPGTGLILPTKENFPAPKGTHAEVAQGLVRAICGHLGLDPSQIDVVALDVLPAEYQLDYHAMSDVAGTWQGDSAGRAVVRYNPNLAAQPMAFLSMLIHELMHHRMHQTALDLPGGPQTEELATDLNGIAAGFGVIEMAGADQAGWQGYMRQETRAYALALFCAAKRLDAAEVAKNLSSRSARLLRRAAKDCARDPDVAAELQSALAG